MTTGLASTDGVAYWSWPKYISQMKKIVLCPVKGAWAHGLEKPEAKGNFMGNQAINT